MKIAKQPRLVKQSYLLIKKNWFIFFAVFVYVFFTCYYMGPSITSCNTTVYGFGDNTAGPIWRASLPENQGLIGTYTNMTNAPFGDNLKSPIGYSLIAQTVLINATQSVAGPICGYSIANMIGFTLSAFVMFGFVYEITKKRWIALLAGFAASYVPYYQLKIGAHFAFGFQAIFIGIIWSFYRLIKYRKKLDAVFLGLLFTLAIYFDPYYSLLAALIAVSLGLAWLVVNRKIFTRRFWLQKADIDGTKRQLKLLIIATIIAAILVLPLLGVYFSKSKQINNSVAASRGNVLLEAKLCSNWPHEYLVPFISNPVFKGLFDNDVYATSVSFLRDHYSCGIGEDAIGLSVTLVLIVILGSIAIIWEKLNRRRTKLGSYLPFEPRILTYGLFAIAIIGMAVAFLPGKFHGIPTPSYVLLKITSTWRTIERIFVIINIAVVALSAIFMTYFYEHFNLKKKHKYIVATLFIMIFAAVLVEYQTSPPFSGNQFGTFNYKVSVPNQYTWLKNQKDIKIIAEYPLERSGGEGNSMAYYQTMQVVHKKKLFNGAVSSSPYESMKTGLKNLSDPQTMPVLKALGVDAIVVHGVSATELQKIPGVKIIYSTPSTGFSAVGFSPILTNDEVNVVSLKDITPAQYVISLGSGFTRNMGLTKSAIDWQYGAPSGSTINILSLKNTELSQPVRVCFDIRLGDDGATSVLKPKVDGNTTLVFDINSSFKTIELYARSTVVLDNTTKADMVVAKLGCNQQ